MDSFIHRLSESIGFMGSGLTAVMAPLLALLAGCVIYAMMRPVSPRSRVLILAPVLFSALCVGLAVLFSAQLSALFLKSPAVFDAVLAAYTFLVAAWHIQLVVRFKTMRAFLAIYGLLHILLAVAAVFAVSWLASGLGR